MPQADVDHMPLATKGSPYCGSRAVPVKCWVTHGTQIMTSRNYPSMRRLLVTLGCFLFSWHLTVTDCVFGQEFVDNFDMNGDYARYVYFTDKVRVWNQISNGYRVRSWGPSEDDQPGVLIMRYQFDKPITSSSVRFNLCLHRPSSHGKVEVSYDNRNYTLLTNVEQQPTESANFQTTVFDLTPIVRGEKQVFLRVTLTGRRLNTSIVGTDFLRTAANISKFNRPYVYEFRAITK
jgi:hypothetical protein